MGLRNRLTAVAADLDLDLAWQLVSWTAIETRETRVHVVGVAGRIIPSPVVLVYALSVIESSSVLRYALCGKSHLK